MTTPTNDELLQQVELLPVPMNEISTILSWTMDQAVANGANSVSMPDVCVVVAHFLATPEKYFLSATAPTKQNEVGEENRTPYPKYWKGDKVEICNEHGHFYDAKINRPETRWSADKEPFISYMVEMADGSVHRVQEPMIKALSQQSSERSE